MTQRGPLLLGVDGGGTSTVVLLADPDGQVIGRARAGPSNAKAVGIEAAHAELSRGITSAFADAGLAPEPVSVACLGIAGFDRPEDRALLSDWSRAENWAERLVLVNDGDLILAAGTPEGWGVGVIAGTGSIAVARSPDGRKSRAGGWGYLIGDEGSAYALVVAALRKVARIADGRDISPHPSDVLTKHLCEALEIPGPERLIATLYAPRFDRARVAALAPAVLAAAEQEPLLVDELLHPAGVELATMAIAACRGLGLDPAPMPLALAGGLLTASPIVREALIGTLRARGYTPFVTLVDDPARGAIILAARENVGE